MGYTDPYSEDNIRRLSLEITAICISDGFCQLRQELESIYVDSHEDNPSHAAFADALFAFLCEKAGAGP